MFRTSGIIFRLDAQYNQTGIEKLVNDVSNTELEEKIRELSKQKPLTAFQYQFGNLFPSNIFLDGVEYVLTKIDGEIQLKTVDEIVGEGD